MKTRSDVLVDAAWLDAHLHDPAVRVVEVDVSRRAHDEWHVEGAVLWDVYRDLKDPDYRLIGAAATMSLLARSGIGPRSVVVFYGYAPALGFWLMKLHRLQDVRILDCSRDAWRDEGHPVSGPFSGPPADRRPVRRARGVPGYRRPARCLLRRRSRRRRRTDHLLHDRRPCLHRLVRPDLPARPRERPGLRRLVGRMGPDGRCPRGAGLTA